MPRTLGFTLIELVVVITVMGILAVGTVRFITDASDGYAATARRTELGSTARLATERVSRELRNALPNSVRVAGNCLEFIPIDGGSTYVNLPVAVASSSFDIAPPVSVAATNGARVVVYPDNVGAVYTLGDPGVVSPAANFAAPDGNNVVRVTLASAHRFPAESPERRLFLIREPLAYCVAANRLWRYQGYGFQSIQPTAATLPTSMPGRSLVGEDVSSSTVPFTLAGATLTRNAEVEIDLLFQDDPDSLRIHHLVQLRNVP